MSKTSDYGTRLVITAPELKVEKVEDLMVNLDYGALPLSSAIVNFNASVIFWIKRFFENEFGGGVKHKLINDKGKIEYVEVKDPLIVFSEDRIKEEMNRFVHGYSNRFIPVDVPLVNGKTSYMIFKGHNVTPEQVANGDTLGESSLINRRLTWCDILYMAATEACSDKCVLVTRFPIDSAYSQTPMKTRISTIKETEKIYVNNTYYPFYPKIREEDIGKNTSHMFIDTFQMCNLYLKGFKGDYDGDQVSVKGVYIAESNDELFNYMNSKANYISSGGLNIRVSSIDAIMAIYSLTKVLLDTEKKLTTNIEFG